MQMTAKGGGSLNQIAEDLLKIFILCNTVFTLI